MTEFKILPCSKRWNYPSIDLTSRMVRTCVRGFGPVVTKEDVEKFGTEIFLNHPYMKRGRELMLQGKYQWDCRGCYEYLKVGSEGFRTPYQQTIQEISEQYNSTVEQVSNDFAESTVDPKYLLAHKVKELEVGLGNLCDLKCIYCTSDWSSMIEAEEREQGIHKNIYHRTSIEENEDFVETFWRWMEEDALPTLENLHLIGGETLFNRNFYVFMERLNSLYLKLSLDHEIIVNIFSNLNNEKSTDRLIQLVTRIHPNLKVKIQFSCESTNKKAEFIRSGLSWERAEKNIHKLFHEANLVIGFAPSFNNLSITSTIDFLKFIQNYSKMVNRHIYIGSNIISHPDWYAPHILTEDFLPHLENIRSFIKNDGPDFLEGKNVNELLNLFHSIEESIKKSNLEYGPVLKKARRWFYWKIIELQKKRGVIFSDVFPEYKSFLIRCKETYFED